MRRETTEISVRTQMKNQRRTPQKRQPSVSQGEGSPPKTNPASSLISYFSLQNCKLTDFCSLRHALCDIFLWQPELTQRRRKQVGSEAETELQCRPSEDPKCPLGSSGTTMVFNITSSEGKQVDLDAPRSSGFGSWQPLKRDMTLEES